MSLILPRPGDRYERNTEDQRNRLIERADAQSLKANVDNTLTPGTRIQATTWDDLRFPASGLNPPGPTGAPGVDNDSGLLLFDASSTEITAGVAQMPHAWAEGSEVRPHVHWIQPAAGNVLWRLEYKLIPAVAGTVPAAWTTISNATAVSTYPGSGNWVQITALPAIDMTGFTLSAMIVFKLARVGGDALDTMTGDASLLEFDIHYQINSFGSQQEFVK
jgi:hypothetical protein